MELISVIIPAYNAERYLRQAVESVIQQAYPSLEILIVTGPSTDNTTSLAQSFGFPIRVINEERLGDAVARNAGIRAAKGELLAFLDADDYWSPSKLAAQLKVLNQDPEVDVVFGFTQEFTDGDDPEAPMVLGDRQPAQVCGVILIRKSAFLRVGLYEEEYLIASTVSWYLRARDYGLREYVLPETVLYRRILKDSLSHRQRANQFEYARALKAHLDRKRGKTNP